MPDDFDLAILGSGFAGSLTAMIARRLGRSVVLIERGRHPRFAIGESSTPLANLLLEELATQYELPRLLPLAKWGTWQQQYPHVACGLKRGFTFYHHRPGEPFDPRSDHANQLLVAASPNDDVGDTHWYRADVDHLLVTEAIAAGVTYLDQCQIESLTATDRGATLALQRQGGSPLRLQVRLLIDATGGADTRHWQHLGIARLPIQSLAIQTLFAHFRGVGDCATFAGESGGAPYPPDLAAVHHVLADRGWIWSLRFNNGITSAGVIATDALAGGLKLCEGAAGWRCVLDRYPSIGAVFAGAEPVRDFTFSREVSFRASRIAGPGYVLLPSAAGFVDPLLSTGFPLTLLGIRRLARLLGGSEWPTPGFEGYVGATSAELAATELLVAALYRAMPNFERFASLTLLYFAAASYSEVARRLGRPEIAGSFLLHDHPTFGPAMRSCCGDPKVSRRQVIAAISPIDVAGLSRADRGNWYPVDPDDTLAAHGKLGVDRAAVRAMLRRFGMDCGQQPDTPA